MYFCHIRCYASSSGQKLDSWFEASGAKFGWGSIQLFPRACGGGDRSWWQDMAEAQWGPPLPPPPPPQHSPVSPSGNGTAWNEVLSLRPSPKPQVFQKQARKHFIRLYETLSQTRWTAGFSPNGECCVRAGGGAVPVVRSACQPRHRGQRLGPGTSTHRRRNQGLRAPQVCGLFRKMPSHPGLGQAWQGRSRSGLWGQPARVRSAPS